MKRGEKVANTQPWPPQPNGEAEAPTLAVTALRMKEQAGCTGTWLRQNCCSSLVPPSWSHLLCEGFFPCRMNLDWCGVTAGGNQSRRQVMGVDAELSGAVGTCLQAGREEQRYHMRRTRWRPFSLMFGNCSRGCLL